MTFRFHRFFAGFVLLLAPRGALAEPEATDAVRDVSRPMSASLSRSAPRLRFDVAGNAAAGVANAPPHPGPGGYPSSLQGFVGGVGFTVDAGVQAGDLVAFYLRVQASDFGHPPFASEAASYAIAEWTPRDWASLGTGLGYEMLAPPPTCNGIGPCGSDYPHWSGLSVPVLVGFNLFASGDPSRIRRVALRIGLEGAAGVSLLTEAIGWHMGLNLGLALM
jgi:hypothetical protein